MDRAWTLRWSAKREYARLAARGEGALAGDEVLALAEWVWCQFHPG
jgi:hypothetical protein